MENVAPPPGVEDAVTLRARTRTGAGHERLIEEAVRQRGRLGNEPPPFVSFPMATGSV